VARRGVVYEGSGARRVRSGQCRDDKERSPSSVYSGGTSVDSDNSRVTASATQTARIDSRNLCHSITMILWVLFAIALLLFALDYKERFTDPNECTVTGVTRGGKPCVPKLTRPSLDSPTWRSKIDAEAPIGGNDADYVRVLQAFYDKVYAPAVTKPRDTDVEAFLKSADANVAGVDPVVLRRMISSGFRVDLSATAAAREQQQIVTTGALAGFEGKNLQPGNARDEVYSRTESIYTPADMRKGELPEGLYKPVMQTLPLRPGDVKDKSTSWTQVSPMSVCEPGDSECMKNVL
jgi:hypothetical protein